MNDPKPSNHWWKEREIHSFTSSSSLFILLIKCVRIKKREEKKNRFSEGKEREKARRESETRVNSNTGKKKKHYVRLEERGSLMRQRHTKEVRQKTGIM